MEQQDGQHQDQGQHGPHVQGVGGQGEDGLFREGDHGQQAHHGHAGDPPKGDLPGSVGVSPEEPRQDQKESVQQPEGRLPLGRCGVEEGRVTKENPQPCRHQKLPQGEGDLIEDPHEQAHARGCTLEPAGAEHQPNRLQRHPIEGRQGGEKGQQGESRRPRQGQPKAGRSRPPGGQQQPHQKQAQGNPHPSGCGVGEEEEDVGHICSPQ